MINTDRMRRYAARTMSEPVTRSFTRREVMDGVHHQWIDEVRQKLQIKHPEAKEVIVSVLPCTERDFLNAEATLSVEVKK